MILSDKDLYWFYRIFPILFCIAFLQTRAILPPYYSPTTGIIVWPIRLFILYIGIKAFLIYSRDIPILNIFILYSIISIICVIVSGKPVSLYINSIAFYVMPMFVAYVGYADDKNTFYKFFVGSCIVLFVIGIYLHFFRPAWYQTAVLDLTTGAWSYEKNIFQDDNWIIENARMQSFLLDSYAISYYSMFSLPLVLYSLYVDPSWKKVKYFFVFVIYASSMLCMQRVSMVCTTGTLIFYYYLRHKHQLLLTLTILIILFVIISLLVSQLADNDFFAMVYDRWMHMSFSEAMEGSRTKQINGIMNAWGNYLFGEGIGTGGGEARKMGIVGASDCNTLKMLYEQGIVGFLLFHFLALKSLIVAYNNIKFLFPEFIIIGCVLLSMIGADPLTYSFYIIPFWYAIGRVWNIYNYSKDDYEETRSNSFLFTPISSDSK